MPPPPPPGSARLDDVQRGTPTYALSRRALGANSPGRRPDSLGETSDMSADSSLGLMGLGRGQSAGANAQFETPTGGRQRGLLSHLTGRAPLRKERPTPNGTKVGAVDSQMYTPTKYPVGLPAANADGSFSVVRDDEEANNSGLLDLSPAVHSRYRKRAPPSPRPPLRPYGSAESAPHQGPAPVTPAGPSMNAAASQEEGDGSIVEHSLNSPLAAGQQLPKGEANEEEGQEQGLIPKMRRWMHDAMKQHLYETAIFWGDKVLSMETTEVAFNDAYWLAQAYFMTHQYARAEHLLTTPLRTGAAHAQINSVSAPMSAPSSSAFPRAAEHHVLDTGKGKGRAGDEMMEDADLEDAPDGDGLAAALFATRAESQLPPALLARGTRPKKHAGLPTLGEVESVVDGDEGAGVEWGAARGKRKERGFTVSGTGTGSSSGSGSSVSDRADSRGLAMPSGGGPDGEREGLRTEFGLGNPRIEDAHQTNGANGLSEEHLRERERIRANVPQPNGPCLANWSSPCRYLAAQCQVRLGKFYAALDLIGEDHSKWQTSGKSGHKLPALDGGIKLGSSTCYLRGQIYLRLDDLPRAKESLMEALALDVKNYEAFSALIDGGLLGAEEQWAFVQGLEYTAQAGDGPGAAEDFEFIRLMYTSRLAKTGAARLIASAGARKRIETEWGLTNNPDVLLGLAEELFARLRWADAHIVTSRIMSLATDHVATLPIHIACMHHLPHLRPALFLLAHRLTEMEPDSPTSWYAVGVWYSSARRWQEARRYFSKASLLDPRFGPSWIAFGHSFAMEGENDQAITAYSTAARKFPDSHLPKLFIGMTHLAQGNLTLAHLFLEGSATLLPHDPLGLNERGVLAYHKQDPHRAVDLFNAALKAAEQVQEPASAWTMTHLNLGLAYRRVGAYVQARESLLRVIELDPHCATAYIGLGMAAHALNNLGDAIGWYHQALAIDARNAIATQLLDLALEEDVKLAAKMAESSRGIRSGLRAAVPTNADNSAWGGQSVMEGESMVEETQASVGGAEIRVQRPLDVTTDGLSENAAVQAPGQQQHQQHQQHHPFEQSVEEEERQQEAQDVSASQSEMMVEASLGGESAMNGGDSSVMDESMDA